MAAVKDSLTHQSWLSRPGILFNSFYPFQAFYLPFFLLPSSYYCLGTWEGGGWGLLLFLHFDKLFKLFQNLMRVLAGFYETLEIKLEP